MTKSLFHLGQMDSVPSECILSKRDMKAHQEAKFVSPVSQQFPREKKIYILLSVKEQHPFLMFRHFSGGCPSYQILFEMPFSCFFSTLSSGLQQPAGMLRMGSHWSQCTLSPVIILCSQTQGHSGDPLPQDSLPVKTTPLKRLPPQSCISVNQENCKAS